MSRVGKKPIPLPPGVKFTLGSEFKVEGPKGKLTVPIPPGIRIEQKGNTLELVRDNDSLAAFHGLTRALAANAVQGVSTGFVRELDVIGTGFRVDVKGKVALRPPDPYKNKGVRYTGEVLRKKAGKTAGGKGAK